MTTQWHGCCTLFEKLWWQWKQNYLQNKENGRQEIEKNIPKSERKKKTIEQ